MYDQGSFHAGQGNETGTMSCTGSSYHSQQLNELLGLKCTQTIQETRKVIQNIILKRNLHRERCRINQARHRKKQKEYLTCITAEVEKLQTEIQTLEKKKRVVLFGIPTKESVWDIAIQYFRLFRNGYITPTAFAKSQDGEGERQSHVQLVFLEAAMSIDVMDGGVEGVNAHLESWRLFSLYHDNVQLQLEGLEKGPGNSIIAATKTGITITENTLRNLYGHLLVSGSDDAKWSPLAYRLLGQRIEMDGSIHFICDPTTGRVTNLQTTTNLLAPILRLVGSIDDVARVFDGAFITLDGKIVKPSVN